MYLKIRENRFVIIRLINIIIKVKSFEQKKEDNAVISPELRLGVRKWTLRSGRDTHNRILKTSHYCSTISKNINFFYHVQLNILFILFTSIRFTIGYNCF